jgi:hypothetical protein
VLEEEAPTQTKTNSCTQVFKRRSKGIVIKDSAVEKDLASAFANANQIIASQREEITALSIKAHQDVVSIITKEIPVHLSSPEKNRNLQQKKKELLRSNKNNLYKLKLLWRPRRRPFRMRKRKGGLSWKENKKKELDAKRRAEVEHKKQKEEKEKEKLRKEKEEEERKRKES